MASKPTDSTLDLSTARNTGNRLICFCSFSSSSRLCERRHERQRMPIHRCIQQKMALQTGLAIPATCINPTSPASLTIIGRSLSASNSNVGSSILDARNQQTKRGTTSPDSESVRMPCRSTHKSPTTGGRSIRIGGMDDSGWEKQVIDWSDDHIRLLESSWRQSTLKTYKPIWNRWRKWSTDNYVQANNPNPSDLAKYLCHLYTDVQLAPKTIALHKSVVANFSNPLRARELSSHILVKQTVRGIFLDRPPTPVKTLAWNMEDMLNFLRSYDFNEDSLFAVSRHTCVLLLLATGRRVHDLTLLSIDTTSFEDRTNELTFWPKYGSKTDNSSYRQSGWLLKKTVNNDPRLDLVLWTKNLISISEERRRSKGLTNLFITTRGAVKNASRSVIAGWIRTLFKEAGISASAGSFRSAVSSHNWSSNKFDIDAIMKRGNWRSKNTFFRHYFRETVYTQGHNINVLNESFEPII